MKKNEVEFVDFGHCLHMDTKQNIEYNGKQYNCIKGAVLHKKRNLRKKVKCYNFNYYWLEHRREIIKDIYKTVILCSPKMAKTLDFRGSFAYIDNGNRNLGIGYYTINKNNDEVIWYGKNMIGEILSELREEML